MQALDAVINKMCRKDSMQNAYYPFYIHKVDVGICIVV